MGIMPWNFPFWQVVRFAVPALLSGNVIILKHASNVSMCSIELQKLFSEACGEADIFQSLLIKADDVASLLQSGLINGVSVTGSEDTGRKVGEAAGRSIIKQVYELGGNDSFIVLKDADIRKSAENAVYSRLINAGQSCISAKRFIVHQSIAEEFLQVVKQQFELRHPGNPLERNTSLAPLAKRAFVDEVNSKLHQARQFGAKALYPLGSSSVFILPNLLSNVNENNPIYDEEIFAPVAILHTFQEDAEAIRLSNSSRYGLSASVWSGDETYATHIAQQLECGSVYINTYSQSDASIPFGGIKFSGYGKEMGKQGLLEFVNAKAIICG
jgi:succinate-semialdehyde dehydrogenase/glutarate-semialdehyde dehydrogenase